MLSFLRFLRDMVSAKCYCGKKATCFPHGVPCCDDCVHEGDCSIWLGYACDCGKDVP